MSVAAYGARHAHAFLSSLGRLSRTPFATAMTLLVIALALSLPMAVNLLIHNAQLATGGFAAARDMSVYLKTDTSLSTAKQIASKARGRGDIAEVSVVSSAEALLEFQEFSGFGAALDALQDNPLPHVLIVRPHASADLAQTTTDLRRYFTAWPEVELVQIDSTWINRFAGILVLLRQLAIVSAVVLGLGVLAVIGNSIRLEILNRRAEIEVSQLVGGSNAFVRRPFLYTGLLYGLFGGFLAILILALCVMTLRPSVANLAALYGSSFTLAGLRASQIGILLLSGTILGWLGAWCSATYHLQQIKPRA
jgi:cell division transport system permease protein